MVPVSVDAAREAFVPGRTYRLSERVDRSGKSHRHYFACVKLAWDNLPAELDARYPTPEHLRKWALVKCGYADERTIVAADPGNALTIVGLVEAFDEYAICQTQGNVVRVWTPKTQNMRAMDRSEFEQSKRKVLLELADLIGVTMEELTVWAKKHDGV